MHTGCAMLSMAHIRYVFKCPVICMHFHVCYHTSQAYDQVPMAMVFNNNHIIYYHRNMQWSVGLDRPMLLT